jgi:predicted NUDIX family phosphoesterase
MLRNASYHPRPDVELDEDHKQVIPYSVFILDDKILVYNRTKKTTEKRLVGKASIGIGGHINPQDGISTEYCTILNAAIRENIEEVRFGPDTTRDLVKVWLMNTNEVPTCKVHIAIVFIWRLCGEEHNTQTICSHLENLRWMTLLDLVDHLGEFEVWSRVLIERMTKLQKGLANLT